MDPLTPLPFMEADTIVIETVEPGVDAWSYLIVDRPWAVHVLDVDRAHCWRPVAVKAGGSAVGRERTSTLMADLVASRERGLPAGAVNADFFLFTPPGVPRGAHVENGVVIAGPSSWPVVAIDSAGRVHLTTLHASGGVVIGSDTLPVTGWNRASASGLAYFDSGWGQETDTASGVVRLTTARRDGGPIVALDTGVGPAAIPRDGAVLVLGRAAGAGVRARLLRVRPRIDSVKAGVALVPFHPRDAVGGGHVILRGGQVEALVDTAGGERFGPFRHPRTALGIGADGRRLLLAVVDGRQPEYSAGMTLRELAELMRALGAEEAINLDGGGSSAVVVLGAGDTVKVFNRPSDSGGERAVANALAVVRDRCNGERGPGR